MQEWELSGTLETSECEIGCDLKECSNEKAEFFNNELKLIFKKCGSFRTGNIIYMPLKKLKQGRF